MGRRIWRRLRNEKGQSFIEFALVAPMALVLILGVVDLGRATSYWLDSSHLANVGARAGAVNGCPPAPPPSPPGCVDPSAPDGLPKALWIQAETPQLKGKLTVCIWDLDPSGAPRTPGSPWLKKDEIRITVRSKFTFIPFLKLVDRTVTGRSSMRLETNWGTSPATNPYGWTYGPGPNGSAASIGMADNQCPDNPN
jgi:TadE-like protein